MNSQKSTLPKAVQDVKRLLEKTTGKSVEPGVVERLVDFEYEYVSELITDARSVSQYLGKKDLDVEDLKLAKEMEEREMNFGSRPNKQQLQALAQKVNEVPLPAVSKASFGLRIPPDRFCMTSANFQTSDVADAPAAANINGSR
ncbi:hypothetical protein BV898_06151 [Hypsibius exemplaris]|uniref:Transcription initiation factor TFIID subunit 9B n=1 Tax=Hypsibius exemplaris TaxID=2072580 RepID=A0A1W0WXL4_HYPEX|nr:hypothetical protein BV898_06151 [Hypsibius exemplaris]